MNRIYNYNSHKNYDEILSYLMGLYHDVRPMKYKKLIKKQIDWLIDHNPILYQIDIKYLLS